MLHSGNLEDVPLPSSPSLLTSVNATVEANSPSATASSSPTPPSSSSSRGAASGSGAGASLHADGDVNSVSGSSRSTQGHIHFSDWSVALANFEVLEEKHSMETFELFVLLVSVKSSDGDQQFWEVKKRFSQCYALNDQLESYIDDLPDFPLRRPKIFFDLPFLRERHYQLQQYFQNLPSVAYGYFEMVEFLNAFEELESMGYRTDELRQLSQFQSTSNVNLSKDEVNQLYNKRSPWYDLLSIDGFDGEFRDKSIDMLGPADGDKVLEIGFGTGNSVIKLAQKVGTSGEIHGVDLSESMLDETMKNLRDELDASYLSSIHLVCRDATSLPYEDNTFDLLYMSFTLELFDKHDIRKVVSECYRVLKGEGRIVVTALSKRPGMLRQLYEWAYKRAPTLFDLRPIFLRDILEGGGFVTLQHLQWSAMGLPVDICLSKK